MQARDAINSSRLPIGQSDAATILAALAYHIETPSGWTYRQKKLERLDGLDLMYVVGLGLGLGLGFGLGWGVWSERAMEESSACVRGPFAPFRSRLTLALVRAGMQVGH